jgi:hypothetical protein
MTEFVTITAHHHQGLFCMSRNILLAVSWLLVSRAGALRAATQPIPIPALPVSKVTLTLVLVTADDVVPPAPGQPLETEQLETLMAKGCPSSGPYELTQYGLDSLKLNEDFQAALVRARNYPRTFMVLVRFTFDRNITAVIDLLRDRQQSPRRRHPEPKTGNGWYITKGVMLFDPGRPVRWNLALNSTVFFSFVLRPAY